MCQISQPRGYPLIPLCGRLVNHDSSLDGRSVPALAYQPIRLRRRRCIPRKRSGIFERLAVCAGRFSFLNGRSSRFSDKSAS